MHYFASHPLPQPAESIYLRTVRMQMALGETDGSEWQAGPASRSFAIAAHDLSASAAQIKDHAGVPACDRSEPQHDRAIDQLGLILPT